MIWLGPLEVGREHRQVFDLPPVAPQVIEHQLIRRRCGCGTATSAAAPAGVSAAVQYGPRISAIIVYLYVGQFLSRKRTAAALAELFGTPVSMGTVAAMTTRAANGLGGFTEWVRAHLVAAPVVNFDETGLRVAGKLRWVHYASTGNYSLITVHDRRGTQGMDAAGVLPDLIQRLTPQEDTASLPPELRLANGELAYARHGSARFAVPGQLAAEEALLAAAVERRAHQFNAEQVDAVVAPFTPPVLADRLK